MNGEQAAHERRERVLRVLLPVAVLALGVLVWDLVVRLNQIPPYILPSPGLVLSTLISDWSVLSASLLVTLETTVQGFLLAAVGGIGLAVLVGLALTLMMALWPDVSLSMAHPWAVAWFGLMGALFLSLLGLLSSIWADKFDHNAAVTNFVIAPLSLLSGTFYVIDNLAPAFQAVSRLNPFFYVISGFRFGFLGQSDIGSTNLAVLHSAIGLGVMNAVLALPEVREKLVSGGAGEPYITTPEQFAALMRADYARYGELIKSIGFKAD